MSRKKKKNNCDSFISKRDKKKLITLVQHTNYCDENSVWDMAVELGKFSVMLRGEILRRNEYYE